MLRTYIHSIKPLWKLVHGWVITCQCFTWMWKRTPTLSSMLISSKRTNVTWSASLNVALAMVLAIWATLPWRSVRGAHDVRTQDSGPLPVVTLAFNTSPKSGTALDISILPLGLIILPDNIVSLSPTKLELIFPSSGTPCLFPLLISLTRVLDTRISSSSLSRVVIGNSSLGSSDSTSISGTRDSLLFISTFLRCPPSILKSVRPGNEKRGWIQCTLHQWLSVRLQYLHC